MDNGCWMAFKSERSTLRLDANLSLTFWKLFWISLTDSSMILKYFDLADGKSSALCEASTFFNDFGSNCESRSEPVNSDVSQMSARDAFDSMKLVYLEITTTTWPHLYSIFHASAMIIWCWLSLRSRGFHALSYRRTFSWLHTFISRESFSYLPSVNFGGRLIRNFALFKHPLLLTSLSALFLHIASRTVVGWSKALSVVFMSRCWWIN